MTTQQAASATVDRTARPGMTLATVAVVQFMVSLDLSVVNVGLPAIRTGLGFSAVGLTWVIHAYALTFGGLLLLGGKAVDRYGRKPVLLTGLVVFGVASLLGGFAQVPGHLVAARGLQGIGAAAAAPAALALLTSTFPSGRARARAFGVWSATNAAGGALGVLIGGVLTQYAGWRWVMLVNVPMVAIVLVLAAYGVRRRDGVSATASPDIGGALLATGGLLLLVFGVVRTDQYGWASPVTAVTLVAAAALLIAFVRVEQTTRREPLLRLGLLGRRSVAGANAYNLLLGAAMASAFYFMSLYLQRVIGHGPARSGVELLPFAFGVVAGSFITIKLGDRVANRRFLIVGGLMTAIGFGWFALISPDGSFGVDVLGPSVVASVGFGLCLGPVVSTATHGVDPSEAGTASGLLNSSRQIGASVGLAVLGTLAQRRTGEVPTAESLTAGYALGLGISAALFLAAVLIAVTVIPRTVNPEPSNPEPPEPRNHRSDSR